MCLRDGQMLEKVYIRKEGGGQGICSKIGHMPGSWLVSEKRIDIGSGSDVIVSVE